MGLFTVTGPFKIDGVAPGGTVDLDGQVVNVDALLEAGHVKPAREAADKPAERPAPARRSRSDR